MVSGVVINVVIFFSVYYYKFSFLYIFIIIIRYKGSIFRLKLYVLCQLFVFL